MSLESGHKLAHYEIAEPIGKGGMGEVYRAKDSKLGREVAIKVLPEELAGDHQRMERFEREARLLAQLNHANVATLHGLEEHEGRQFLVMELVEGETLAERIGRGPLPVDDAIPLFAQIAEGLDAAHEKGIIHRDLKPANIKIGPDGTPKILDFGLAKAFVGDQEATTDASQSPTLTKGTALGVIMGTASYMSPEQARGKALDRRTDIWAFGCCLYEALSGRRAFAGETVTDTLAKIVEREPDWSKLPKNTPRSVRRLLERCLRKRQEARLKSAGDIALALREDEREESSESPPRPSRSRAFVALGLVVAAGVLAGYMLRDPAGGIAEDGRELSRWVVPLPPGTSVLEEGISLSPDGRLLVVAAESGNLSQLYLKALDSAVLEPIPGTEDGFAPFFSPDSEWIGFFARGQLQKIRVDGGRAIALCDYSRRSQSATWGIDGTILYRGGAGGPGLLGCSADGGEPKNVTQRDREMGESSHVAPSFLPDGSILFGISGGAIAGRPSLAVLPRDSEEWFTLPIDTRAARYVSSGYLVYERDGRLLATAFDPTDPTRVGRETILVDGLYDLNGIVPAFAVSTTGTLAFLPGSAERDQLVWVDRQGRVMGEIGEPGQHMYPRLSPQGDAALVSLIPRVGDPLDIWLYDTTRGSRTRLTFGMTAWTSAWAPDGRRIAFQSSRRSDDGRSQSRIYTMTIDAAGTPELLATGGDANSWSPDGQTILIGGYDDGLRMVDVNGGEEPRLLWDESYSVRAPVFSPDGQWIAYTSDETERNEIYVQPYPGPGRKYAVSTEGGSEPIWSRDGRELFFRDGSTMMAVDVRFAPEFQAGEPRALFQGNFRPAPAFNANYDVHPDGDRFLMIQPTADAPREIHVIVNWTEELKRLVPPEDE